MAPSRNSSSEIFERSWSRYVNRTKYGSTVDRRSAGTSSSASNDWGSDQGEVP